MKSITAILLVGIVLISGSLVYSGETVRDEVLGFKLKLPDGFKANPELARAAPKIVHGFVLGDPTDSTKLDIILLIEKMRGTIGREKLSAKDLPRGFKGRMFTTRWQGFEVEAFEVPEKVGEIKTTTFNVQIPLKYRAIQVKLFGPTDRKAELKSLLSKILDGLKGDSNWTAGGVQPTTPSDKARTDLLIIPIAVIGLGLVGLWLISRKVPRGLVLMFAIGIWVAGNLISGSQKREDIVLSGSLKFLGVIGGVLGIVEVVRSRKSAPEPEHPPG